MRRIAVLALPTVLVLAGCGGGDAAAPPSTAAEPSVEVTLQTSAFAEGADIPAKYSRDGGNLSPPLAWSVTPADHVAELVLVMYDLDADFTHWLVAGIDPASTGVGEGAVPPGAVEGKNDFGDAGYGGPDPPGGERHRYVFTLYVLGDAGGLEEGFSLGAFDEAVADGAIEVLGTAEYAGLFQPPVRGRL